MSGDQTVLNLSGPGQARRSDPGTAKQAAYRVEGGNARHALLTAFRFAYSAGLTPYQANQAADGRGGMEYATRCSELQRLGLVAPTGELRVSPESGMKRRVLAITAEGVALLNRLEASDV